jgi:predicted MFS family arabinose efflux permease
LIGPVALWCLRERPYQSAPGRIVQEARAQFRSIGRARTMWAVAGIATVFYIAPGVFTALFYIQQNNLHMNTEAQGFLQLLNGAFGMLAALLYGGVLCRRFTLRTLLMACMVLGAIGNLAYWFYATPMQARVAEKYLGIWLHDGRGLNNARDGARHAARQRGAGIFGAHVGA